NSYSDETNKGYFAKRSGFEKAVKDTYLLTNIIEDKNEKLPLFLFGHSMGSLIFRRYIQQYHNNIAGVILSGTAGNPGFIGKVGLMLAKLERLIKGNKKRSPLMDKLIFGN